jgi:hypothetical protein
MSSRRPYVGDGYIEDMAPGTGWIYFAGFMLLLVGCFNIIDGIAALANSSYVADRLQFANVHAWGWFFLIWGIVQLCAGVGVWMDAKWAVVVGIVAAFGNVIAQLGWERSNPFWAAAAIVLDVLVIYGLVVYGGRRASPDE